MRKKLPPEFCTRCGTEVPYRKPSQRQKSSRAFCSRQCHLKMLNAERNPTRMTPETRKKLREAHVGIGKSVTYTKLYGRHEHRVVAEKILGRELRPGEIVHHLDGDKRNNSPENLKVFASQSEHMRWHLAHDPKYHQRGGDRIAI